MATLLKLDSSPMGERSISRKLTTKFAESWLKTHPGGKVVERDLTTLNLPVVDAFWAGAVHTPEATRTAAQVQALATSDSLINDLEQADEYVFGVPMHNFSIPSTLKLWIDQIVRAGTTFSYVDGAPAGLIKGKRASFLITSGGVYDKGTAMASFNFVEPYL